MVLATVCLISSPSFSSLSSCLFHHHHTNNHTSNINVMFIAIDALLQILFQPHIIGSPAAGLGEVLEWTFAKFPPDVASALAANVFVTGRESRLPGLVERVQREVSPLTHLCCRLRALPRAHSCGNSRLSTRLHPLNSMRISLDKFVHQHPLQHVTHTHVLTYGARTHSSHHRSAECARLTPMLTCSQPPTQRWMGGVVQVHGQAQLTLRRCLSRESGTKSTAPIDWWSIAQAISLFT